MVKKRGKKKLPDALKIVKGTAQKCRMNPDQPEYSELLECPAHFKGELKEIWMYFVNMLTRSGVAQVSDEAALEMLCEAKLRWTQALDNLDKHHMVDPTTERTSGYHRVEMDRHKQYLNLLGEYGLTASSRQGLKVDKPPKNSDRFAGVIRK